MNNSSEINIKIFLFFIILLFILSILSRNYVFVFLDIFLVIIIFFIFKREKILTNFKLLSLQKRDHHVNKTMGLTIKDGLIVEDNNVKGILIVDDIPFDYRDLSEESLRTKIVSFHKVLDVVGDVEIIFRKQAIDKNNFLERLFLRAQNLRVIIEADPSNEKAKNELELIQNMIKKINEGESPFKFLIFFVIKTNTEEKALATLQLLKKGLESIGVRARLATKNEIIKMFQDRANLKVQGFPTQVPFLTTFSLPKSPKFEFLEDGIYIGKEIGNNRAVFWNFNRMLNPHVLLVGPTGAGKTEFLISLGYKVNLFSEIPVVFFDTKSDIKLRLKKYNIKTRVLNPLLHGLGLLNTDGVNLESYIPQLESILENSFKLDKYTSSILYKLIREVFHKYGKPSWDMVLEELEELELPLQVKTYIYRIISEVRDVDRGYEEIINLLNEPSLYIVDLSLIKSEEIRRLIMLSLLTKVYNKYNIADDKLKIALVVDEAWTIIKESSEYSIITDLVKRGRGFGIMLLMATQNIIDLGNTSDIYLQNIGLIAFMNNGDKKFWQEVLRFVNMPNYEVDNELTFLGRGEAIVRFITDPRPVKVVLDSLVRNPF